jgi:hypothetical protein
MRQFAALFLLTGVAFAQSQQPSPSHGEISHQDQAKPQTAQQPTADHEQGTRDAPIVIEMMNPPNGDSIAAEIKKNRDDQSTQERHSIIFNCLLVAIGALQGGALIYTALVTNKAANAAKDAAEALPTVERAYIFIVAELKYSDPINTKDERSVCSSRLRVEFRLENHGKTPAVINSIDAQLRVWSEEPDNTRHIPSVILPNETIIKSGDSWTPPNSPLNFGVDEAMADAIANQTAVIWFYGSILYQDMFGNDRVTRFRWGRSEIFDIFGPRGAVPYNQRT